MLKPTFPIEITNDVIEGASKGKFSFYDPNSFSDLCETECESKLSSISSQNQSFSKSFKFLKTLNAMNNIDIRKNAVITENKGISPKENGDYEAFTIFEEKFTEILKSEISVRNQNFKNQFKNQKKYKNFIFNSYASKDDFDNHLLRIHTGFAFWRLNQFRNSNSLSEITTKSVILDSPSIYNKIIFLHFFSKNS